MVAACVGNAAAKVRRQGLPMTMSREQLGWKSVVGRLPGAASRRAPTRRSLSCQGSDHAFGSLRSSCLLGIRYRPAMMANADIEGGVKDSRIRMDTLLSRRMKGVEDGRSRRRK